MWNKLDVENKDTCPEYIQVWADFAAKIIEWLRRHV